MPPKSAPDRLRIVLDWVNGAYDTLVFQDPHPVPPAVWTDYAKIRERLAAFIEAFDGSEGAGFVEAAVVTGDGGELDGPPPPPPTPITNDDLDDLRWRITRILGQGLGDPGLTADLFPASVDISVRGVPRATPRWRTTASGRRVVVGGAKAWRDYRAAGAYILKVEGSEKDLIPFLVGHLLTQREMVAVHRCEEPSCGRFIVQGTRGRPRRFCKDRACWALSHAAAMAERLNTKTKGRRRS